MNIENIEINTKIKLNNSIEMPLFGLGTYQAHGKEAHKAVLCALEVGYRLIDTASAYGNEREVGEAIRRSGIPREEIFVTTKLWNSDHGYDKALAACEKSLERLGISYIDLYLIHWPVRELRHKTWKAMEVLIEEGKCRAIGVSNYMVWHLEELIENSSTIPAVNQVEFSPYLYLKDLLEFCRSHKIQLESYSPLTKGQRLDDPRLGIVASKYKKTPSQILIRWVIQHEVVVIPKSANKERIRENANVFDFSLSREDLEALDTFHEDYRTSWDPTTIL